MSEKEGAGVNIEEYSERKFARSPKGLSSDRDKGFSDEFIHRDDVIQTVMMQLLKRNCEAATM